MLLGPPKGWEYDELGFFPFGRGDGAWRLGLALIAYPELHDLFYPAVLETQRERLRYLGPIPDHVKGKKRFVHPYYHFSRDHRIMGLAGLFITGHEEDIERMKITQPIHPGFSMRPTLRHWINYLKSGDMKEAKRFHNNLGTSLMFTKPKGYTLHLMSWMLYCCPNESLSQFLLREHIPPWNLLLRILNNEIVSRYEMENVISWEGYQWQDYKPRSEDKKPWPDRKLGEDEAFKLDVDILNEMWAIEFTDYRPEHFNHVLRPAE
jgi:hypothetical protein